MGQKNTSGRGGLGANMQVIYDSDLEDYDGFIKDELENADKHDRYIMIGKVQTWNGIRTGYKQLDKLTDVFNIECDRMMLEYDKKQGLFATYYHHDGVNHMKVKAVKDNLPQYMDDEWQYNGLIAEDFEKIEKYYSRKVM